MHMPGKNVDYIYAAMLGERPWTDLLKQVTQDTPAGKATLQMYDYQRPENSFVALQSGFDEAALQAYRSHYVALNILQQSLALRPNGIGFSDDVLVSREQRAKDSFFNEWLAPNEVKASAGVKIDKVGAEAVSLVLLSDKADGTWRNRMARELTSLAPHLQRASDFYKRRNQASSSDTLTRELLNVFGAGALLIRRGGHIEFMSPEVMRLLEGHSTLLCFNNSRLHVRAGELSDMISQMSNPRYTGPKTIDYYLSGLKISLIRPEQDSMNMLFNGASLIVVLRGTKEGPPRFDRKLVARTYNLTPAEMRALDGLVAGKSVAKIALEAKRSRETIRVQIRSLYVKIGAHSEADVIRLVRPH